MFRFRKTFGRGPLRFTATKRGVGWRIGGRFAHFGVSPDGRRYVSLGIPGTGLYWIKYLDPAKPDRP